jgi:hypothetical protein
MPEGWSSDDDDGLPEDQEDEQDGDGEDGESEE